MKEKLPLSVAIITYNEEDIIGRTLEAVKDIASEIVVVDSGSTDRTREIAESYGAKVYVEEWKGYAGQKNSALEKCTQEWVLFLDADEVVSEELKRSIIEELRNPKADGYIINRRTYYLGKLLKYTWQPEWRLRLVKKSAKPLWKGDIHEAIELKGSVKKLKGSLIHYSYRDLLDHVDKIKRFCRSLSITMYERGKKAGSIELILHPLWMFFKTFLLKRGFLDGYPGLIASVMTGFYTFLKYAMLKELEIKDKGHEKT